MKLKIFIGFILLLMAVSAFAAPPQGKLNKGTEVQQTDNTTYIDANRILMFVTNHGNFGRDLSDYFGHDYGTWYPYGGDPSLLFSDVAAEWSPNYASGIWVGGYVGTDLRTTISEYSSEYVPGPMAGGTFQTDQPEFRVYKLYKDSLVDNPNQDYLDYMAYAVPNQGAPVWPEDVYDVNIIVDGIDTTYDSTLLYIAGEPQVYGDQFLWSVYNDADPSAHNNMETAPLGIEVKQSIFAYDRDDAGGEVIFFRYRVYNKGANTIDSCYISLWCDPDLGTSGDDYVGCDTVLGLGFVYNADNEDSQYGDLVPPSMGFDFLQGPLVAKTDPGQPDGRMWGQVYTDSTNLSMTSFNKYINGTDPDDANEAYNYMRGLTSTGGDYTYEGQVLKYVLSGDPFTRDGDLDEAPADRRWMQSTGPLTFAPGDSTEIYAAIVMGQAASNITSIVQMKSNDRWAQLTYDSSFVVLEPPAPPIVDASVDGNLIYLQWQDTSEVDHGTYPFEGYLVFQGETNTGPWTQIAAYDLENDIVKVLDEVLNSSTGVPENVLVKNGNNNGVQRYISINEDFINNVPLRDLTTYYYSVEAYTVDNSAPTGFKTLSASTVVSAIPEIPRPDYEIPDFIGEMLTVEHSAGVSDGFVTVEIVNPDSLTGHDYQISFADTIGIVIDTVIADPINHPEDTTFESTDIAWFLIDVTDGDTLLAWMTDQSLSNDVMVTDGFVVKVSGPNPGFTSFQVVANGAGAIDPPESAGAPWYDFPVPTGVDPDGYPTDGQQVGDGLWLFHTADNGGTNDGGTRATYDAFLERVMRNDNAEDVGIYDWEMRFTAAGGYAVGAYEAAPEPIYEVPFELWRIGIATPDDPSDDVRLMPWMIDEDGSGDYNLQGWGDSDNGAGDYEHSVSGGNNDPQTDWVYWILPADDSPGEAGYNAGVAMFDIGSMNVGTYDFGGEEVMARTVLVNWNGGSEPPFNQDLPEEGTVFRFITGKPNAASDVFAFSTTPPSDKTALSEEMLDDIKAVPNPFYLYGSYDPSPGNNAIKFHHLPATCTIKIFNLSGELIDIVEKDDASTSIATWDVLTDNGLPVASGIYVYVVEAPGIGQKVGKMAVFVEDEVLKIY